MAKGNKGAGEEPAKDDPRALCADIYEFQAEADRAFSGAREFYIVWALCKLIVELRLLRAGVRS